MWFAPRSHGSVLHRVSIRSINVMTFHVAPHLKKKNVANISELPLTTITTLSPCLADLALIAVSSLAHQKRRKHCYDVVNFFTTLSIFYDVVKSFWRHRQFFWRRRRNRCSLALNVVVVVVAVVTIQLLIGISKRDNLDSEPMAIDRMGSTTP